MRKEGEIHAAEDAKRKEEVEVRNTADNMAYMAEKKRCVTTKTRFPKP